MVKICLCCEYHSLGQQCDKVKGGCHDVFMSGCQFHKPELPAVPSTKDDTAVDILVRRVDSLEESVAEMTVDIAMIQAALRGASE